MTPRGRGGLLADSASRLRGDGQGAEGERTTAAVCRAGGSHGAGVGAGAGWVHDWFAGASDGFDGFDDQPRRPGELSGRTSRPADNPDLTGHGKPRNLPTRRQSRPVRARHAGKPHWAGWWLSATSARFSTFSTTQGSLGGRLGLGPELSRDRGEARTDAFGCFLSRQAAKRVSLGRLVPCRPA